MQLNKPPKIYQEQVEFLESRGMVITDHAKAAYYLSHINYYRLRGYWLPLEEDQESDIYFNATSSG